MAATIGATLLWICDFAVTSCGWTLAATFELVTVCVTCVVQPASAALSLAMTASPAGLTAFPSPTFEWASAGLRNGERFGVLCGARVHDGGAAATVSTH